MEINFVKNEEKILKFWRENKIFEKSIEKRKNAKKFVFFEGPPTANGKPGIHHVLSRVFKDIICRYKTMQGFRVERKAGWDTHGLPVELEIEKKLGLKNKKDIEDYGIARFNKKCKESVWEYLQDWEKLTERIGFWLDLKNPYITYETDYIETVWFILKEIYKKGLLSQDYKVVPYCPRCGTTLSSHEVAQGYKKVKGPSIYIKFQILNPEFKDSYLLVWTTTPWTLPGNVAVAINPAYTYIKVKFNNENLILVKDRMEACGLKDAEILKEFKGKDLLDLYYQAPYPIDSKKEMTTYRVLPAEFVSLEDGSGMVHIAPAFGLDDMELIKKENVKLRKEKEPEFPILLTVNEEGKFKFEVKKWAGMFVKDADPLIIADLRERSLLYKEELYEHDYPFCWRCKSPLLYYAKQSWFINMQAKKQDLIKNNQKINWVPGHLKEGRFGEWLKEVKDWAISRERYWGTPLPIWKCKTCNALEVLGSKTDLVSQKFSKNSYFVIRHGESYKNKKDVLSCWPEKTPFNLTEKGKVQIATVAKKLKNKKIDLIFSSDILRTKQTAEIIAKDLNLKVKLDKRLREINIGILNGKKQKDAFDFWGKSTLSPIEYTQKRFQVTPPEGENYADVEKRMLSFMKEMENKYQGKNILLVSHQRPITLLEKVMEGFDIKKFADILVKDKEIKLGEIREFDFANLPYDEKMEFDFHRPYIDEVKFYCKKCGAQMERVPEVLDCWFDSGSMPFAQNHWPFVKNLRPRRTSLGLENLRPPELFPADYICEAIDQTRGWFYTLLAVSTLLDFESPYKNVISVGHVLDEKGEKMSKSKGNIVDPWYIIGKYGIDAARWYFYTINQPGEPKLFSEKDIDGALKKFILTFWNCYIFLKTYGEKISPKVNLKTKNVLDRWIISRQNQLIFDVTNALEKYDVTGASRLIEKFVVDDLSLWYVRRSRRRFQRPETKNEAKIASEVLGQVIFTITKLMAPFLPFLSEEIYQETLNLESANNSVHFQDWPKANKKMLDKKIMEEMEGVREIVAQALAERARVGIKVRQPLRRLKISALGGSASGGKNKELLGLIRDEVNVKEVVFDSKIKTKVELDTEITPELKEEGTVREIIRNIQELRKKANFKPSDSISVRYSGSPDLEEILSKNEKIILKEGKIKDLQKKTQDEKFNIEEEITVDQQKIIISIKKI
ncbi:MAG: class I tRNA ligase family protein [Candidatus Pacebacteria bacterium]|nr:class I tRNA ligase family protein [Candidatus Paceibacterota bacterium]